MDCSLLTPIKTLPWYLYPVWPLIFWRIQRVKAWFHAAGGPGSQMLWGVDLWGRVVILSLSDDLSGRGPALQSFTFQPSEHFRAALSGENFITQCPHPRRRPGSLAARPVHAAQDPGLRREYGQELLPPPDT